MIFFRLTPAAGVQQKSVSALLLILISSFGRRFGQSVWSLPDEGCNIIHTDQIRSWVTHSHLMVRKRWYKVNQNNFNRDYKTMWVVIMENVYNFESKSKNNKIYMHESSLGLFSLPSLDNHTRTDAIQIKTFEGFYTYIVHL